MNAPLTKLEKMELKNVENPPETIRTMTIFEARDCVKKINDNIHNARALYFDLYERKGWEALGYRSWRECVIKEFGGKQAYAYLQLSAAKVERNISTIVEKPTSIPESHLRPLAALPPEEQREVYKKALESAPEGKVTARHIEQVINRKEQATEQEEKVTTEHVEKVANGTRKSSMSFEKPKISERFEAAWIQMNEEIKRENLNGWKETEKMVGINYINMLLTNIA